MKSKFINVFLEMVQELPSAMGTIFARESMYYKDLRVGGFDPQKIYRGFRNLERRGILKRTPGDEFKFTLAGRTWYRKALLRRHRLNRTAWDRKWRVVLFDIPNEMHNERNKFRAWLRRMGFHMIQKSVFVFPYHCEGELAGICEKYRIHPYVNVLIAESLGFAQEDVKKAFRL